MHLILGVDAINFRGDRRSVGSRPSGGCTTCFMLVFAWLHCANGVRIVLDDYIRPQGWRVLAKSILYVVVFILIVLGAYVIFTFKP